MSKFLENDQSLEELLQSILQNDRIPEEILQGIRKFQSILHNVHIGGSLTTGNITQILNLKVVIKQLDSFKPPGIPQNVPPSCTRKFVGHSKAIERLHQMLQQDNPVVITAIEGMGGVGKTELAIQYALIHLLVSTYTGGICWLRARDEERAIGEDKGIKIQLKDFAETDLGLKPPDNLELTQKVRWCLQRWPKGNVLLVLDDVKNYEDVKLFLSLLPSRFKVLITTRLQLDLPEPFRLNLDVLSEPAALELLEVWIGAEKLERELTYAKILCQWLGYLPLALNLVGRYLKKHNKSKLSLAEMLRRLEEKKLTHESLVRDSNERTCTLNIERGVAAAFELSWEELSQNAKQLGCFLSLFALAPIPCTLVKSNAFRQDTETLEDARIELETLHLLQGEEAYQLHPLIREFLRNKQNTLASAEEQKFSFCQAMVKLAKAIPDTPTPEEITTLTLAIPHLAETTTVYKNWLRHEDLIAPFMGLVRFYKSQIAYDEATSWCEKCCNTTKERFGQDHLYMATSLLNLAYFYELQGRYADAESFLLQALKIRRRELGENELDVATILNNLGSIYCSQGRYADAESFLLQALKIRRRELGENEPDVAQSLNNLALVYFYQRRYSEAERFYQDALILIQQLQGNENPEVAISLNNLALLYYSQKRYSMAEDFFNQSLQLLRKVLGNDHPDVATNLTNLALLYRSQKRYSDAKTLYQQAIQIQRDKLGNSHPHLAVSLHNLAECCHQQKDYFKAELYYNEALNIRKQNLQGNRTLIEYLNSEKVD